MNNNINVVKCNSPEYPELLRNIKNPPKELFYSGDISCLSKMCVAVVGSRTSTAYGRKIAGALADRLARNGVTVVSGMASGIDSAAHIGCIEAGGRTAAVFGCGPDICYPAENIGLMDQIRSNGVILSEYPPGTKPMYYNFPERNRIISGLAVATVVVQARTRSGALITAELADEQGRIVLAVPGNIDSSYNMGNNKLIRDGVTPLVSVDDILDILELNKITSVEAADLLSENEFKVYEMLESRGEMTIDELCIMLGKPPGYVTPIITVMEMKGFVFCEMGKVFLANV